MIWVQRDEASRAGYARLRCPRNSRVVHENETDINFIAVELVVVLDPHDAGRVEIKFGQPALREREEHQDEEQDCERYPSAAGCRIHGPIHRAIRAATYLPGSRPFPFNALGITAFPDGDAREQGTDK